jgi:hypothetical protein
MGSVGDELHAFPSQPARAKSDVGDSEEEEKRSRRRQSVRAAMIRLATRLTLIVASNLEPFLERLQNRTVSN